MPRSQETVYANMSFNPRDPHVQAAMEQATSNDMTLGTYLKKLVLALLADGPLLLLHFQDGSRIRSHLMQEAQELEMPLDVYVLSLLADRDRNVYKSTQQPISLWYPPHYLTTFKEDVTNTEVEPEDDVNIEEAMQNVHDFFADMTEL